MSFNLRSILSALLIGFMAVVSTPASAQTEPENVILVLDASGSMWGRVDGTEKIVVARNVIGKVLADIGDRVNLGVVAYGHRSKGDCSDIEKVIPVGPVDTKAYMSVINGISPKGKTPITDAVRQSAEELRYTENKATVILVSDGLETCEADPCALAAELEKAGIDFTAHVIGFDLKDTDTSSLRCLAETTGGKYLAADNADDLGDAIGQVVAVVKEPEPEPEPVKNTEATQLKVDVHLSQDSPPLKQAYVYVIPEAANKNKSEAVVTGSTGPVRKVAPGKYYIETKVDKIVASVETVVVEGELNTAKVVLNAGLLSVNALPSKDGAPLEKAYIYVWETEQAADGSRKQVTAGNQRNIFTLAAGKYFATAKLGKATVGEEFEIVAGRKTDLVLILGSGVLKVTALSEEGGAPMKDAYIYVYEAEQAADGSRKQVTAGNQRNKFTIPAGTYYITAKVGKAVVGQEVTVAAGKMTEAQIILGVGALKVSAIPTEGAKPLKGAYITVFEKDKALDGKRESVTAGNQRNTFKLPAGIYYVVAKAGKAQAGMEVEVKAGKLVEPSINVNAGSLSLKAAKKMYVTIYAAEKNLDGTRDRVDAVRPGKPFILPAGSYFLQGKIGDQIAEAEVEVKAGKLVEVELTP